jgi:hypothetical protein
MFDNHPPADDHTPPTAPAWTDTLIHIQTGEAIEAEDLLVVPLLLPDDAAPPLSAPPRALADALQADDAEVRERDGGASVGEVVVELRKGAPLLLIDGEELVGAKQNRVVNSSVLVGAGQPVAVPVSCIERGRWERTRRGFHSARRSVPLSVKRSKLDRVSSSVLASRGPEVRHDAGQGEVWRDVDAVFHRTGIGSATSSLSDVLDSHERDDARYAARTERLRADAQPTERQLGAAFFFGGRLLGLEVFGHPATLRAHWPALVTSYASDVEHAAEQAPARTRRQVGALLCRIAERASEPRPSPGAGQDRRLRERDDDGSTLTAAVLTDDERLVHVTAHLVARPAGVV